jgi:NADH:ubiquinone oxidoreductase subunit 5 (subunit L)/multisubunit Na+/H+ antiporter MnhA subunit
MEVLHLCLLLAVGLPFLGSPLVALAGKKLGTRVGWLAFAFPVISTTALIVAPVNLNLPGQQVVERPWIPSLGINLSFLVDGLSLFFGLIVSGMGCLIFFYANHYLDDHVEHHAGFIVTSRCSWRRCLARCSPTICCTATRCRNGNSLRAAVWQRTP